MTPDLPPQSCFDPHRDFPEIGFVFRVADRRFSSCRQMDFPEIGSVFRVADIDADRRRRVSTLSVTVTWVLETTVPPWPAHKFLKVMKVRCMTEDVDKRIQC